MLFSTTAGAGHFGPMVPIAKASRDAGHTVRVAAPASFAEAVTATGLDHAPFSDVPPEIMGPIFGRLPELSHVEANRVVMAEIFGRLDARRALPELSEIVADWRPDIVVREFCEFGSLVAAAKTGVPQVEVAIGLAATAAFALPIVEPPLAELDAIAGLPEGTAFEALASGPVLSCVPAEVDGHGEAAGETGADRVWRFRDISLTTGQQGPPPPWDDQDDPLVYVTFGSVAAGLPPFAGVYRAVLDALASEPVRVLMTTGRAIGPGSLGPLPTNARVEQWWSQAALMPQTDAVVGHGGFGTTMIALAGGVPQVVMPLFAFDQFVNAERVAEIGAGVRIDGGPYAASLLAPALAQVLGDSAYQEEARRVAAAMAALPDPASSVSLLERLAATLTRLDHTRCASLWMIDRGAAMPQSARDGPQPDRRDHPSRRRSNRCRRPRFETRIALVAGEPDLLAAATISETRYGALVAGSGGARRERLEESIQTTTNLRPDRRLIRSEVAA